MMGSSGAAPMAGKSQRTNGLTLLLKLVRNPRRNGPRALAWLRARIQLRGCTYVGPLPQVDGRVRIHNSGRLVLHEHIRIRGVPWASELAAVAGGTLEIGAGTFINSGVSISACESVRIGRDCRIGPRVFIMDNDFHIPGAPLRQPASEPVVLDDLVWVGAGAIILKGVRIGRAATVGAGSVVTHDVPPGAVVAGVPARPVARARAEEGSWR